MGREWKEVIFLRHGESSFNVWMKRFVGNRLRAFFGTLDSDLLDAPLTEKGWKNAFQTREKIARFCGGAPADVVLTSPLTRALQTAYAVAWGSARIEALPSLQEWAVFVERGRTRQKLEKQFPGVDFSHLPDRKTGVDPQWWYVPSTRYPRPTFLFEPFDSAIRRVRIFRSVLLARPEGRLVVVGHSFHFGCLLGEWSTMKNLEVRRYWLEATSGRLIRDIYVE